MIVSGSEDHTCIIWDLNTLNYVRQLSGHHDTPVTTAAVHEVTGEVSKYMKEKKRKEYEEKEYKEKEEKEKEEEK